MKAEGAGASGVGGVPERGDMFPQGLGHPLPGHLGRQLCFPASSHPTTSPFRIAQSKPGSLAWTSQGHDIYQMRQPGTLVREFPPLCPTAPQDAAPHTPHPSPSRALLPGTGQWAGQIKAREGTENGRDTGLWISQPAGQRPQLGACRERWKGEVRDRTRTRQEK